jgi:ketosteroid isomerase-like protein
MAHQNVELIRGLYDAFAQGGITAIPIDLVEPDFELVLHPPFPSGPFQGQQGIVDFAHEFDAMFEQYRVEPEELIDAGDSVAVVVRFRGRGAGGGVPVDERIAHVWTLRDGKVVRPNFYSDVAEALEAVGVKRIPPLGERSRQCTSR